MKLKEFLSVFNPGVPATLIYMLQSTEYQAKPYLLWLWRIKDFRTVAKRRNLDRTKAARLLLLVLKIGIAGQWLIALIWLFISISGMSDVSIFFGITLFISAPLIWAHLIVLPLVIGRWFIINPKDKRQIAASEQLFAKHLSTKIAVAGSYGKTSMKELLLTVLSEGKKTKATPANKNVASSHAQFIRSLDGDEEVIIIEYGEGKPGDVAKFSKTTHPTIGVITGIAPAHLDHYKSTKHAAEDIFSLSQFVDTKHLYVNGESQLAKTFIKPEFETYSSHGALGWKVSNVRLTINGTSFTLKKGKKSLKLESQLLGRHQIGPLAFAAALADQLGLSKNQIEAGIAKTTPYEHRMQPYQLHQAWIIDDTYNGNLEGVQAGLKMLAELTANRKIYVTPGLVDQGAENQAVHEAIGKAIAEAKPDKVVLMNNSVTKHIQTGMNTYNSELDVTIIDEPLKFYTNLDHFVSAGDLVLMQNDWTDNYA